MDIRWQPGALAALATSVAVGGTSRFVVEAQMEGEREAMRLAQVIPPGAGDSVREEVEHREQKLKMRPADAYRSVADDLIAGRWLP